MVFRLRTGHNHLNHHLYSKLCIGHTEQCPCSAGSQTTEHLLQSCPLYKLLSKGIWPDHTPVACKLYGMGGLRCTATFNEKIGVSIWQTRKRTHCPFHAEVSACLTSFIMHTPPNFLSWLVVLRYNRAKSTNKNTLNAHWFIQNRQPIRIHLSYMLMECYPQRNNINQNQPSRKCWPVYWKVIALRSLGTKLNKLSLQHK